METLPAHHTPVPLPCVWTEFEVNVVLSCALRVVLCSCQ